MKTNEILEGNKLIAEFMGWEQGETDEMYNFPENFPSYLVDDYEEISIYLMRYHSSWDWLMPVVEKIKEIEDKNGYNIFWVKIDGVCREIQQTGSLDIIVEVDCESKIEAVFMACVQFIKWYNQNK